MKSFLVIAIFALVGFCFSSAAFIDVDENEMPESVEDYKSTLESILRDATKQIRENLAFDENMVLDNFEQENIFGDEQSVTFTEEEEGEEEEAKNNELSPIKSDYSTENVGSGIRCSWQRNSGECCQSLRIIRFRVRICLGISVHLPFNMQVQLKLNGRTVWRKTIGVGNRSFKICLPLGPIGICIKLYDLHISRHNVKICLRVSARIGWVPFSRNLGCISKRFAIHEIPTITNELNPSRNMDTNKGVSSNSKWPNN